MVEIYRTSKIEETLSSGLIRVCLMKKNAISGNMNHYNLQECKNIAKTALGKDVFYGIEPLSHRHDTTGLPVGKIVKSWFESSTGKVLALIRLTNRELRKKIVAGFGVSIKAIANKIKLLKTGIFDLVDVRVQNVQIIDPSTARGVQEAKVESIIEETFSLYHGNLTESEIIMAIAVSLL